MNFFQGSLEKDFGYSDDHVIESLRNCTEELHRAHLDLPPPPTDDAELPSKPFGVFVTPTIEQIIGRQSVVIDGQIVDDGMVIPADGGPVVVPMSLAVTNHRPSSISSSSVLDHYDTATDGMSSRRISIRDGRSSVTSMVDEFLDVDDDVGDITADDDANSELRVDSIEVNDNFVDAQQWPWSGGSTPYISADGPLSRMTPAPALRTPQSPLSDSAAHITVGRNTVGMVSLNQPVSTVTVVTGDDDDTATPPAVQRYVATPPAVQRNIATVSAHGAQPSDAGVRDFFALSTEPWSHYVRSSPYPSFAPPFDRHPSNTTYHLYALKSAKDLSRQRYFSSGRVDDGSSHRSRPNGLYTSVGWHQQAGALSAPAVGTVWPENNGWSRSPVSTPVSTSLTPEQPVLSVRSRVLSPSGNQVGSKVIFPDGSVSSRSPPYLSSISQQPWLDSKANWTYRL